MTVAKTHRRRTSPLRTLDTGLVKALCELHPWDSKVLCEKSGLDPTVLSHFFAGRRPLPMRVAGKFLSLLGLRVDGSIDTDHCFVLKEQVGNEALLKSCMTWLFPNGGKIIHLNNEWINCGKAHLLFEDIRHGVACFDGRIAAVIHGNPMCQSPQFSGHWELRDYDNRADRLLSLAELPTKANVAFEFAHSQFVPETTWEDVQRYAETAGLTPYDTLGLMKLHGEEWYRRAK